jgi:hypothetical protein
VGPTWPSVQGVPVSPSSVVKPYGHESDRALTNGVEVKNE